MTRRTILAAALGFWGNALPAAEGTAVLSGRLLDRVSGRLLACRVTVKTPAGIVADPDQKFSPAPLRAGEFRFAVPPGEAWITVERGFDYESQTRHVVLAAGERRRLDFALKRVSPLRSRGWLCGDSHNHLAHGERRISVQFSDVALAGCAAGLDYLSVSQYWNVSANRYDVLDRACRLEPGKEPCGRDLSMTWNLEAPKNYYRGDASHCLGHGWTLGMRGSDRHGDDIVTPMLALNAHDYESGKTPVPNFEIHAWIHRLGGIVSYTHPCRWWRGKWGGEGGYPVEESKFISNIAQELPFDTLAGPTYDTLDVMMQPGEAEANRNALQLWFELLNHGYRIPATASSDSTFDNPGRGTPGRARVYTRLDGAFSWERIAQTMKAGRNFATNGPLIDFQVNGRGPGESVALAAPVLDVRLQAWASGEQGESLTRVEVLANGEILKTIALPPGRKSLRARFKIPAPRSGWCIAIAYGHGAGRMAVANPVYFGTPDERASVPAPVKALVTLEATDARTGAPVNGECEVFQMTGPAPETISKTAIRGGKLQLAVPATARVRVGVPGYRPLAKSIFLDDDAIREMILNLRVEALLNWGSFEKIRSLLGAVRLDFSLQAEN